MSRFNPEDEAQPDTQKADPEESRKNLERDLLTEMTDPSKRKTWGNNLGVERLGIGKGSIRLLEGMDWHPEADPDGDLVWVYVKMNRSTDMPRNCMKWLVENDWLWHEEHTQWSPHDEHIMLSIDETIQYWINIVNEHLVKQAVEAHPTSLNAPQAIDNAANRPARPELTAATVEAPGMPYIEPQLYRSTTLGSHPHIVCQSMEEGRQVLDDHRAMRALRIALKGTD